MSVTIDGMTSSTARARASLLPGLDAALLRRSRLLQGMAGSGRVLADFPGDKESVRTAGVAAAHTAPLSWQSARMPGSCEAMSGGL